MHLHLIHLHLICLHLGRSPLPRSGSGLGVRASFRNLVSYLRASYWFVPTLMILGAFLLSLLTLSLDERVDFASLELPLIYLSQPEGAKTMLGTVAGSMLSVASLTFSIVMVVLTMASSQFGPRLLGNFMRDRGNQLVLGSFLASFLYSLLVLRTVRGDGDFVQSAAFVPQLSLTVAVALTVVNLGAFVYFIHHTAESVQVTTILARVSHALTHKILSGYDDRTLFPASLGQGLQGETGERLPDDFADKQKTLFSSKGGYLRIIDNDGLLKIAREHDLVLELLLNPGDYVMRGGALAQVYPGEKLADLQKDLEEVFALGPGRTQDQDMDFLFDQLLEVALRALSPGINDPFTAMMCVDRIADNLVLLEQRDLPEPYRYDDDHKLRVVVPVVNPAPLVERLFGPIRSYGKADVMTLEYLLRAVQKMAAQMDDAHCQRALAAEAERIKKEGEAALSAADYARLLDSYAKTREAVLG